MLETIYSMTSTAEDGFKGFFKCDFEVSCYKKYSEQRNSDPTYASTGYNYSHQINFKRFGLLRRDIFMLVVIVVEVIGSIGRPIIAIIIISTDSR